MSIPLSIPDQESGAILRALDLEAKADEGLVRRVIKDKSGPPKHIIPWGDLPLGTAGQQIRYFTRVADGTEWEIVKAHRYRFPDGTTTSIDPLYICMDEVVLQREERH